MLEFSTSSWTTHGLLGKVRYDHDFQQGPVLKSGTLDGARSILDLPEMAARENIFKIELCHFHFPTTESGFLQEVKSAAESANVTIENLLLDSGNLSTLDEKAWQREISIAQSWQAVAKEIGANGCRFYCGTEPPSAATKRQAIRALTALHDSGREKGVGLTTENFHATAIQPADLIEIVDSMAATGRSLNLCVDFGNAAKSGDKYGTLEALLPRGTSLHCKGEYLDGQLDQEEFNYALSFVKASGFDGFVSLIYDGTDGEWEQTLALKEAFSTFFNQSTS